MRILFLALEPPLPAHDGGRIRTYNILKHIAGRNVVTFASFSRASDPAARVAELDALCSQVVLAPRPPPVSRPWVDKVRDLPGRHPPCLRAYNTMHLRKTLAGMVASAEFDVAHIDQILLAQYAGIVWPVPTVLTHHNVEALVQRRELGLRPDQRSARWWAAWLDQRRWARYEVYASRQSAALVTVSEAEASYFGSRVPEVPVFVVPNGVDTGHFRPGDRRKPASSLLFTGRMDYGPNEDAVAWFCAEVLPRIRAVQPQATLTIVGRDPSPGVRQLGTLPGVTVTGTVEDVRPYFSDSTVYVAPLRFGAGTRLKVLEAMAMAVPVVTTSIGCEGLGLESGSDLEVADTAETFAAAVTRLLQDETLRARFARQARRTTVERFDWSAIAERQEEAYAAAVKRGSRVR